MSINVIILTIFFAVLVFMAFFFKNSTLDRLPFLPGETVLFEENGIRVEQSGSPRSAVFINCIVRVTDLRIIIAQKILFSGKYALRHVIFFNRPSVIKDTGVSIKKGYLIFAVPVTAVRVEDAGESCVIRIDIPESMLTKNQYISFRTSMKNDYNKFLHDVQS